MKNYSGDYYIGLDMGTASVGWAVTDPAYHLLRAKGKDMWGVRLFSEANTAADRRSHRTARRNLQRAKVRENLLKELFKEEIKKVDPNFLDRLEESKYYLEDKELKDKYMLFNDKEFTDKDYYDAYPTIFHLINDLMNNKDEHDVRLVFLACLNIFKHRGHFLNENLSGDGIGDVEALVKDDLLYQIEAYNDTVEEENRILLSDKELFIDTLKSILPSKTMSQTSKELELEKALRVASSAKNTKALLKLLCGLTVNISVIFPHEDADDEYTSMKISFSSSDYEEKESKIYQLLNEDEISIFETVKKIHDWGVVSFIMNGHKSLSEARVEMYEKHKADLAKLKKVYKTHIPEKYDAMFRIMSDNNYCSYVGKTSSDKASQTPDKKTRLQRRGAKCNLEKFFNTIKTDIKDIETPECEEIRSDIDKGVFLPKQLTASNGAIPYQLHMHELEVILANASAYLPFLLEKDDTGLTVKEKVLKLFEFRIPYYVGPVYNDEKHNAWSVRKENGPIYPWNFEQKIDVRESAEQFIERMVRHCTYMNDEKALPKDSLLYERYRVLNEINSLSINGERISADLKKDIYDDLFKKGRNNKKRVSKKRIREYLVNEKGCDRDVEVTGVDDMLANVLSSYGKFQDLLDTDTLTDSQEQMAEEIIRWSTIYGDSKKFLRSKIEDSYGENSSCPMLSKSQIDKLIGYKFRDWGKFSREFLNLEGADRDTGEIMTIIGRLTSESHNIMELLSDKYTYKETLEEKVKTIDKTLNEITHEDLEGLYISSPVRRMAWQTILILKEITDVMGKPPKKIFVEMARSEEEKDKATGKGKRKDSRKKKLEDLYKACKDDSKSLLDSLSSKDESELRAKKLYLYYMQKGRCMYSGEVIDLGRLATDDYDIDHIYPQSVVKDDSLEHNMVLVKRDYNNNKSNNYPLPIQWQSNMKMFWKNLREDGFITEEKYKRLTRKDSFTDDELANFVNRQLVETRQATKVVAELFKTTFGDTTSVVYVKAGNVSDFRHKFSTLDFRKKGEPIFENADVYNPEFVKCREMNDLHHAKDAYLNIVVGNAYDVKFTSNPRNYIKEYRNSKAHNGNDYRYHMNKIFDFQIERGGVTAWNVSGDKEDKSLYIVSTVLNKNTPLVTRMNFTVHGQFFKQTILSADKAADGEGYVAVKTDNSHLKKERYGGYSTLTTSYFFLVEHTKKKKRIRTIEAMPLLMANRLKDVHDKEKWCADKDGLGLIDPKIRLEKIMPYSRVRIDGFDLCLTGKSSSVLLTGSEVQLKLASKWGYYIKQLNADSGRSEKVISKELNEELYAIILDKNKNGIFSKRPSNVYSVLASGVEIFRNMTVEKQVDTLKLIMKEFSSENQGINYKNIGGAEHGGKLQPGKNITDKNEFMLINQSVTGLYESKVDLLKI